MITDFIWTRLWLCSGHHHDPITCSCSERRVMLQPFFPLVVPVFERLINGVAEGWVVIEGGVGRVKVDGILAYGEISDGDCGGEVGVYEGPESPNN